MAVDSLISAAKVCDCVNSSWCWQVCDRVVELTGKNNGCPFLDILRYLKNTHKNPKFGKVRQVPTREFPTKFPDWDLSHSSKFGILWVFFKFPKISKNGNRFLFLWLRFRQNILCQPLTLVRRCLAYTHIRKWVLANQRSERCFFRCEKNDTSNHLRGV